MTTATKLNIDGFKKLLGDLASTDLGPHSERLKAVVEQMDTMNRLLEDLSTVEGEGDLQEVQKRIQDCQRECREVMQGFLSGFGTTIEETEGHFADPENFSQEEWENIQNVRRKVAGVVESTSPSPMNMVKKHNKKK